MKSIAARYDGRPPSASDSACNTSGVDPHGIVSIAGGDWTVDHPVPIFNAEQKSLASTSTWFPASRSLHPSTSSKAGRDGRVFTRPLEATDKSWRENMTKLLTFGAAAIASAAFF